MKTSWIYCYSYIHVVLDSYLRDIIAIYVHMDLRSMQMLQIFFLSNLYRNHCCFFFFVHQQTVSVTQTPHDNEGKWNVVCCAVSICMCLSQTITQCSMLEWECFHCIIKKWESTCSTVSLSVLREQHTPQHCVNV